MKKNLLTFGAFLLLSFFVFGNNLEVFFTQDDFILIDKFSQNNLLTDSKNILSYSETHFRPVHNFYFLLLGNVFDTKYVFYHLVGILIHTVAGFLVFKLSKNFVNNTVAPFVSALFYIVNSSHFVTLYWISGNAVEIGFVFFCLSFLFWISKKHFLSLFFLCISMLVSEAFVVGFIVIAAYEYLLGNFGLNKRNIIVLSFVSIFYGLVRFVFLTPQQAIDSYKLVLNTGTFSSLKYYILRVLGISEIGGDFILTIILLTFYGILIKRLIDMNLEIKKMIFLLLTFAIGLFPFILLQNHLSPHYMNLSIFAISVIVALALREKTRFNLVLIVVFLAVSAINVHRLEGNSWVTIRSRIAEAYIRQIEDSLDTTPDNAPIVFNDNRISSSLEAYISLGGGKALDFWFKEKNFKYCFVEFESCESMN